MSERIKNAFAGVLMLLFLVMAIALIVFAVAYARSVQPSSFRSFSVQGEGRVVAVPDIAQFSFGVITEGGKNIASLQQDNTTKANRIIELVKSKGVEDKDIKTENYNLEPRYQYFNCSSGGSCPPPEIIGYTIRQSVQVKIRDFSKISELIGGVVEKGANNVSELRFTVDDPTSVQNKAREEAIAKARSKAESVARAGGFSIGKLLSIDEGFSAPPRYYDMLSVKNEATATDAAPAPTIEPGSQEIMVNITLQYEIR